ncbi:MAG: alpha/beta hydrolase [Bacteroidetes bacterium]|nr:alpha/beta hydrolase [Bacteroidota bacterium]
MINFNNIILKLILFLFLGVNSFFTFAQNAPQKTSDKTEVQPPQCIYGQNQQVGKFYAVRGINLYCEIYGEGPPLLFIHGNGGSIKSFEKQIPYFASKYKVIIADSRAQGRSADLSDSLSYEMMADDFAELLNQLNIDSANIIGWSDGGINGLLLAIRHPEKVKMLAITGANITPDTTAIFPNDFNGMCNTVNTLKDKTNKTDQEKTDYKLNKLMCEQPNIPLSDLQKIAIPTLVIAGDHDLIRLNHTLLIHQNIKNAFLWILPNSGHATLKQYPEEFNQKVDAFLSKNLIAQ